MDEGYLFTADPPNCEHGVAHLSPPAPGSSRSLEVGLLLSGADPDLRHGKEQSEEIPHVQCKRNPSKKVGVARGHQRADTLKP